ERGAQGGLVVRGAGVGDEEEQRAHRSLGVLHLARGRRDPSARGARARRSRGEDGARRGGWRVFRGISSGLARAARGQRREQEGRGEQARAGNEARTAAHRRAVYRRTSPMAEAWDTLGAMAVDRNALDRAVDELSPELEALARRIHEHPELAFEEHRASAWIAELLEQKGLRVERALGGLATAFRARIGARSGPTVAILAEYDALPEIGHACGHNLIASGAVGAFLALSRVADALPGAVTLIGTPAEEGGGGKIRLLEAGAFEGVEAAMMYHPYDRDILAHPALANRRYLFTFHGAPAHAAMAPWDGRSALTACLE